MANQLEPALRAAERAAEQLRNSPTMRAAELAAKQLGDSPMMRAVEPVITGPKKAGRSPSSRSRSTTLGYISV